MSNDLVTRLRDFPARDCCSQRAEAADRIEALEKELYAMRRLADVALDSRDGAKADVAKLESIVKEDNSMLRTYHKWCDMNGCAPSSSDLMKARAALEGNDE